MAKARKFSPIFDARVTPVEKITVLKAVNGTTYGRFQADVDFKGGTQRRNVMAFGDQFAAVRKGLRKGRPVVLAIQHDNGTVKVIGYPREAPVTSANDAAPEAAAA